VTYKVTFEFERWDPIVRTTPLGQAQTFVVPPVVVREDGTVAVKVMNGFVSERGFVVNPEALNFPKQGLSVSFSPGSYRINFARVMCVLWVKLAFLAMIGVFAGTFLSFSVASLVAFVLFWAAESAPLITRALEVFDEYDPRSTEQKLVLWRWAVVSISKLVTSIFKVYGDLQPTGKLIDGVLLSWGGVAVGAGVLGGFTVIFFFVASTIFKRRELAIYSGN
jgi:uncharacterized membrane protein